MATETFRISPADFAASDLFLRTFDEGMDLVEQTASYLEGPGRHASRELSRSASLVYATESMRLTTQLMQLASWLLVHRAVREGEIAAAEAFEDRFRLTLVGRADGESLEDLADLPQPLKELSARADALFIRAARLDQRLSGAVTPPPSEADPVGRQLASLAAAFGANPTDR